MEEKKMTTYGVYNNAGWANGNNDQADWFNTCEEALKYAMNRAVEDKEALHIMKFTDDECAWDFDIEVDECGKAWSEDWDAREEMGCIQ